MENEFIKLPEDIKTELLEVRTEKKVPKRIKIEYELNPIQNISEEVKEDKHEDLSR